MFCIINEEIHEDQIIKYSIKFMRLLSSYIVDQGWEHNTEDRVTHRGIDRAIMKTAEEGETYRLIIISKSYIKLECKVYFEWVHIFTYTFV